MMHKVSKLVLMSALSIFAMGRAAGCPHNI